MEDAFRVVHSVERVCGVTLFVSNFLHLTAVFFFDHCVSRELSPGGLSLHEKEEEEVALWLALTFPFVLV